jgi:hypothetical protein
MSALTSKAVDRANIIAVVGASNDVAKYGCIIYEFLRSAGYRVYPINPREEFILGDRAYPDIGSLPEKPDVLNVVTQPQVTEVIIDEAAAQNIGIVWLQPGSESAAAIARARELGMDLIHNACIMRECSG